MKHYDLLSDSTVYLLDASIYIFQAWFGVPDRFHDQQGRPVNALYGYFRQLLQQYHLLSPQYMLAAFDESLFSGFRHQLYPDYKANRALPDDALVYQLRLCREITEVMGIPCVSDQVYEADDLLAWGAKTARQFELSCTVISRDKDLAQIVFQNDTWWDWSQSQRLSCSDLQQYWKVSLQSLPDLLALSGDAADNIPGVKGIGLKTAQILLQHFGCLEDLFTDLEDVLDLPVRGSNRIKRILSEADTDAYLFRELIRLRAPDRALPIAGITTRPCEWDNVRYWIRQKGLGAEYLALLDRIAGN